MGTRRNGTTRRDRRTPCSVATATLTLGFALSIGFALADETPSAGSEASAGTGGSPGADEASGERALAFLPETPRFDSSIPRLREIAGHDFGERMTPYTEMIRYLEALAESSPRVELHRYGRSWQERDLCYLVVSSVSNLERIDEIRDANLALADGKRDLEAGETERRIASLPATVWLSYTVHGDEASGTDAALLLAYWLAAAESDDLVDAIRENCVVILDPLQNPDGRERFVHYFRDTRGRFADPDPFAAEHVQPWPSGRVNHYLFDMNRDWYALTQPESRARVRAYLEWMPQVFVDAHEMGGDSSYYFPPPAEPINPHMRSTLIEWTGTFGRNHARWFDRMGFDYFTREIFDSFFPGYGESWPLFQGAVGMTYEMASTAGLVRERRDGRTQHYRDAVQRHFLTSISTCETAARERERLLDDFRRHREAAVHEGATGSPREFLIVPGPDPAAADELVALLLAQGIEVDVASGPVVQRRARDYRTGSLVSRTFPVGTYRVPLAQPARPLIVTLLDRHTEMSEDFLAEQRERLAGYEGHEIYDITGWSLPLLFGVEAWRAEKDSEGPFASIEAPPSRPWGVLDGREADVAYLVPWTSSASARLLARLTRAGIRVSTAREAFTHDRTEFPAGSLIVRVRDPLGQPDDLHARVDAEARDVGVAVHAVDSSWVDEGVNFGSGRVDRVEASKIALAWGSPTRANSAGATRYVLERRFDLPVTCLPVDRLARTDLDRYDVLILPDGSEGGYAEALGKGGTEALARFVRDGGTLVALADAVRWLAREDVGLLPIERERKGGSEGAQAEGPKREASETDPSPSPQAELGGEAYLRAIRPDIEYPNAIPGAILRVRLDTDHWLAHGYPREICVLADTSRLFGPIRIDRGRNIGIFAPRDEILASGVGWAETLDQAAGKPWLVHRPIGRGNIVAFTEDPTFRASLPGLELSLMNAILRSPRR